MIQVTPELLQGKAQEVRGLKQNHDETMNKLRNLIMALNEQWKGEAQDAFVQKYESMQSTFTNFSEMLENYSKLMETAANELQQTDQSLKGRMSSM